MTADQAVLRTTLLPGLVEAARTGVEIGAEDVALFEIARVYLPSGGELPEERVRVGGIVQGEFHAVKGVLETLYESLHLELRPRRGMHALLHPGKAAEVDAGVFGELHPSVLEGAWGAFELDLPRLFEPVRERIVYEDVVTYPAVRQDIAVVVDEDVEVGALVDAAREAGGALVREAKVFDIYRGEQAGSQRKSVAIHLAFQSSERTLTDEEAAGLRERIVDRLREDLGAELRA